MALRVARHADIPALEDLIRTSGLALSLGFYSPEQAHAIVRHVFGVDRQLIDDGTYFIVDHDEQIVACGGWSKRRTLFGGDRTKCREDTLLDPSSEPARIRAFFVHPSMARRGLGRQLMAACIPAATAAGFRSLELVATLPGEPLYRACGFTVTRRFDLNLPGCAPVPVAGMRRELQAD